MRFTTFVRTSISAHRSRACGVRTTLCSGIEPLPCSGLGHPARDVEDPDLLPHLAAGREHPPAGLLVLVADVDRDVLEQGRPAGTLERGRPRRERADRPADLARLVGVRLPGTGPSVSHRGAPIRTGRSTSATAPRTGT